MKVMQPFCSAQFSSNFVSKKTSHVKSLSIAFQDITFVVHGACVQ